MAINKPTFPEISLDRLQKAEMSWEISFPVLEFSPPAVTSHHPVCLCILALLSVKLLLSSRQGMKIDYNLYGKQRLGSYSQSEAPLNLASLSITEKKNI